MPFELEEPVTVTLADDDRAQLRQLSAQVDEVLDKLDELDKVLERIALALGD